MFVVGRRTAVTDLTMGIDIGTTSVKGVVAGADGDVVARVRVPHALHVTAPDRMEHDAGQAWRRGPRRVFAQLSEQCGDVAGVAVSAMVPSMTAVDRRGRPQTPGLLYGDARGRVIGNEADPAGSGEAVEFLRWTMGQCPDAAGFWSAPAVANFALGGEAVLDSSTAFTMMPLFGPGKWDDEVCAATGVEVARLPRVANMATPIGRAGERTTLVAGSVDAMCEQLVSGAAEDGDVQVLCGTTLIIWAVVPDWRVVPNLWTIPHTAPGKVIIGGASNAGGLFLNWADRLAGPTRGPSDELDPRRVPVWSPYVRGERTPFHDPDRRAVLADLDLTHGPAALRRAAFEAAGFVVRHHLELAGVTARRIVATGGGTRVDGWMRALADCAQLPVHVAAVPEGAALGAAFLARMGVGLETSMNDASRWATTSHIVEPDDRWMDAAARRYVRFLELASGPVT
jgi:xylulokinase